jgi:hypothetical protein
MNFKEWRKWLKSKPLVLRWFPFLILFRPVIDSFYWLKEVSPVLSPANIIGILTPILVIAALMKTKKPPKSSLDKRIGIWFTLLSMSILVVVLMNGVSQTSLEQLLKLSMPIYIFVFLRRFIETSYDLEGILKTLIFSLAFVAPVLLYETFIGPIRVEVSRDMERIQGLFGDVVSYGMYISFSFLAIGYFYIKEMKSKNRKKASRLLIIAILMGILGLTSIHHIASYAVYGSLFLVLLLFSFKRNAAALMPVIIVLGMAGMLFGETIFSEKINPLLETDLQVVQGEEDSDKLLHGRVGRWQFMAEYYTQQNVVAQFFGFPYSFVNDIRLIGSGAHSDYARIIFITGYAGIAIYMMFLFGVYNRSKKYKPHFRFLVLGALAILMLYSISITPTYYPPFMYIILSVFAFMSIPINKKKSVE